MGQWFYYNILAGAILEPASALKDENAFTQQVIHSLNDRKMNRSAPGGKLKANNAERLPFTLKTRNVDTLYKTAHFLSHCLTFIKANLFSCLRWYKIGKKYSVC